jgi:hypothetical protein
MVPSTYRVTRSVLLLVALLLVIGAVWWGASWIDRPPDSTCGGLHRPDLWLTGSPGCTGVMLVRSVVVIVLVGTAVLLGVASAWLPDWARKRGRPIAAASLLFLAALMLVNEAVRSGGLNG